MGAASVKSPTEFNDTDAAFTGALLFIVLFGSVIGGLVWLVHVLR